uniref:CCDC92 domain-containing protein n=1 Tax=Mesocestoides corti TaxID=53468 RepID=A0A5K3F4M1_MESCO
MKAHCDILSDKLEHERLAFESEIKAIRRDTEQFCQVERIHKEALLKYDKKMKENSCKAQSAFKKLQIQETKTEQIQKEINDLKKTYLFSLDLKSKQEQHLRYFTQFYEFLNSVILYSEEFAEINDLIKRAEALENLKFELKERE